MVKNIPCKENQRFATKATLPSRALNQDRRPNKEFPRQKKSKRIHYHQTSSARDAKGTALRKGRKREREREEHRYEKMAMKKWQLLLIVPINNNLKCKWTKCSNQKT